MTRARHPSPADRFRRIALGMDGAVEGAHMGHPDFRANGKIFATLHPDLQTGMVKLTRLRTIRERALLTQQELAALAGVHYVQISRVRARSHTGAPVRTGTRDRPPHGVHAAGFGKVDLCIVLVPSLVHRPEPNEINHRAVAQ